MYKLIVFFIFLLTFSCKQSTSSTEDVNIKTARVSTVKNENVIHSFDSEDLVTWSRVRVDIEPSSFYYSGLRAYSISRGTALEPSYLETTSVQVKPGKTYKVSLVVKKSDECPFLGLRIVGKYPDRVDAIYNLDNGTVLGVKVAKDFQNPKADIEKLKDDWFKCSLTAQLPSSDIKLIMGATTKDKDVSRWEGKTNKLVKTYIVPSSIIIEEVFSQH
ncbi:hypothetical protein F6U93_13925 [Tamlana haliotis]|uniref:CBM-cenC domain-containing protein n=1 Tax=Pseudotamlana haliotis TaxID=2614804 RepID=A0A6N6MAR8_9FLAO|nr:hypothetical protein [Tamlana haliotis]KAB1066516.1 hypothetical protein F6U93_13925 [Tamlana haliotis]